MEDPDGAITAIAVVELLDVSMDTVPVAEANVGHHRHHLHCHQ